MCNGLWGRRRWYSFLCILAADIGRRSGFTAQEREHVFQAFQYVMLPLRKFPRVEFKCDGALIVCIAQVVKESGQRQNPMPRKQVLTFVTIVGKMDISNASRVVAEKEVVDEICFS